MLIPLDAPQGQKSFNMRKVHVDMQPGGDATDRLTRIADRGAKVGRVNFNKLPLNFDILSCPSTVSTHP